MKFRQHRGGLEDSMKTMVEVKSWDQFLDHLSFISNNTIDRESVAIEEYSNSPDTRINWNKTCIVMAKYEGETSPSPIGFTDCMKEEI